MNKNKFVTIEYNSSNKKKLSVNIFKPLDWCSNQYRSGIILFHGGGFKIGSPERFYSQSLYFASKGYVVFVPEYRTQSKDNTGPYEATYDGHYFYNWLTKKSRQFGVEKNNLIVGGASAGAQIAASIANKNIFESQNSIKPLDPCKNGDVHLTTSNNPYIFWDGAWHLVNLLILLNKNSHA